ncbi:glycerophosphodiester phosphodiesterase [Bowmanella sp. Y26]|uniref:glycerophosphodiester phosphodiesterase family protein n=1 Tax=Bowmanella yangjiangensis TaxID=2811230 RepID=UPI001BDBD8EA|nr:glycerophosphodiester phosphodiesterase family protein [Bowmanella yangjiangensis]MBT1065109.1 glycerophosphodiester phosphodiesterase [Bowmanella yangjiangensis]
MRYFITLCFLFCTAVQAAVPLAIAHRGVPGYLPEHSKASLAYAHALGADMIEFDVNMSADGVPVVLHDLILDEVSDVAARFAHKRGAEGKFWVKDFTLAELRSLRFHERRKPTDGALVYPSRFNAKLAFELVTLDEALAMLAELNRLQKRRTGWLIELKKPGWYQSQGLDMGKALLDALRPYQQSAAPMVLQSFDVEFMQQLRGQTRLPLNVLLGRNKWDPNGSDFDNLWTTAVGLKTIAGFATGVGVQIGMLLDDNGATKLAKDIHDAGLTLNAYTVRLDKLPKGIISADALYALLMDKVKVQGIISDQVDDVLRYRGLPAGQ